MEGRIRLLGDDCHKFCAVSGRPSFWVLLVGLPEAGFVYVALPVFIAEASASRALALTVWSLF